MIIKHLWLLGIQCLNSEFYHLQFSHNYKWSGHMDLFVLGCALWLTEAMAATHYQMISQEHVSAEIWMKYLLIWLGGKIRFVGSFSQPTTSQMFHSDLYTNIVLCLSHTFHCFQTHLVCYSSLMEFYAIIRYIILHHSFILCIEPHMMSMGML